MCDGAKRMEHGERRRLGPGEDMIDIPISPLTR